MDGTELEDLLLSDVSLREVRSGIYAALPPTVDRTSYETRAAAYDRVVGSWLYNRLMWGVSPERYRTFVRRALRDGSGPLLDAGSGSAVFTAEAYVATSRPVLLVDRSIGMLEAARDRIKELVNGDVPEPVTLLHADVQDLPLRSECVATVLSMGMLHLFEDAVRHVEQLLRPLTLEGALFATSLVAERWIGQKYLRLLHRTGEVATPRAYAELHRRLSSGLEGDVRGEREGSMAFFTVRPTDRSEIQRS